MLLRTALLFILVFSSAASASKPENVLVVVNANSAMSRSIGEYYARRRSIPSANVCTIKAPPQETVSRDEYTSSIASGVGSCLKAKRLVEQVLYIVTTQGVPLRVKGATGMDGEATPSTSPL